MLQALEIQWWQVSWQKLQQVDYDTALIYASACGTATAASKGIAKRSTIDRVVTALYKKMGREMPASIAEEINMARKKAESRENPASWLSDSDK